MPVFHRPYRKLLHSRFSGTAPCLSPPVCYNKVKKRVNSTYPRFSLRTILSDGADFCLSSPCLASGGLPYEQTLPGFFPLAGLHSRFLRNDIRHLPFNFGPSPGRPHHRRHHLSLFFPAVPDRLGASHHSGRHDTLSIHNSDFGMVWMVIFPHPPPSFLKGIFYIPSQDLYKHGMIKRIEFFSVPDKEVLLWT